jgi:hypothetical protein
MSNPSDKTRKELGKLITQRMPRGRMRIDPDVIPEIATWIWAHGLRYERQREATMRLPHYKNHKYAVRTVEVMEYFLSAIQHMLDHMCDTMDVSEWNKSWVQITGAVFPADKTIAYEYYHGQEQLHDLGGEG